MVSPATGLRVGTFDPGVRDRLRRLGASGVELVGGTTTGLDRLHLVAGVVPSAAVDVVVPTDVDVDRLWRERLVPWADNLAAVRRAPRARRADLVPHRPRWADDAARLLGRLVHAAPLPVRHADHVGSTAVPGLDAKPLLDLQLVLDHLPDTRTVTSWALDAGVVPVGGDFYAIDRHDARHPETVLVDADPGRPVNVHLHPVSSPVWREVLVFRDWLRARPGARAEYARFKHALAGSGTHVDDYGRAKREWVNDAVSRAERWASGG